MPGPLRLSLRPGQLIKTDQQAGMAVTLERLKYTTWGTVCLCRNCCIALLKRAIMHRKNSMFYKTQKGARVGDLYMSLIHSAELNQMNPFDYLVALLRNHVFVEENPEEWLPWNYLETLAGITAE
jgi:hypothetical protein